MNKDKGLAVIGSYNVGLFLKGERLPQKNETIIGDEFYEGGGGKGSNQAIAASKCGAHTRFICRIGQDKFGQDALEMYKKLGVDSSCVIVDEAIHSGISVILIDKDGANIISVVPGANFNLNEADIDRYEDIIKSTSLVGFQLENKLKVVDYAIRKVHSWGVKTLLDPAPAVKLPNDLYSHIDYIKPNETEATILTGIEVRDHESAQQAGEWLVKKGAGCAIVTLGDKGSVVVTESGSEIYEAPKVKAIDTTGAGDVFSGALMASLAKGEQIEKSIKFASHAAALSVTKLGVVNAIPELVEIEQFMAAQKG